MSKNQNKKIWLVIVGQYNFTIIANSEEECKELVDEVSEGAITEKLKCIPIGHIAPTMEYFADGWEGESFILTSNYYNI